MIGLSSLQVMDLFRPAMETHESGASTMACAYSAGDHFALVVFRQGRPTFLRIKPLITSHIAERREQLTATLWFYKERLAPPGGRTRSGDTLPLFLLGTTEPWLDVAAAEALQVRQHVLVRPEGVLGSTREGQDVVGLLPALAAACSEAGTS
jgi:hypothetical protein